MDDLPGGPGATWAGLLLADPSPCLRRLVLVDLLGGPDDPEVRELEALMPADPLAAPLLARQGTDGSWQGADLGMPSGPLLATAQALLRLGYLGFGAGHPAVQRGAEYLFGRQQPDGSWPRAGDLDHGEERPGAPADWEPSLWDGRRPLRAGAGGPPNPGALRAGAGGERGGYDMIPLQTAYPLRGLAMCGYAEDPRAGRAYTWLLERRLTDGAWPVGTAAGNYGYIAGYRRLPHSRWGCRSNTTGALSCLALHPVRRASPEARQALDLLLGRETREAHATGFEVARLVGAEPAYGFISHFARFDLAQVLDLCWRTGYGGDDPRVADLVAFVAGLQGPYGLWEYAARPQVSRWISFDILRSLSRLDAAGGWVGLEPRTPFQPYPRQRKRY